jgi:hypothetical protein
MKKKEFKAGDLIRSEHREHEDEVCLVLQVYSESLALVQRSKKRSYEKSKIAHINPKFYYGTVH